MITLRKINNIAIIELNNEEQNKFNPFFVQALLKILDELREDQDAKALIFVGQHQKYFSLGFDTDWAKAHSSEEVTAFFAEAHKVLYQTLLFPKPTIACINGHAFGLGAIWASAFDFRVMNSYRGWFCFSSVNIGIKVPPAMISLSDSIIPTPYKNELLLMGAQLSGIEAQKRGVVHSAHAPESLLDEAIKLAKILITKDPQCYAITKDVIRQDIATILKNAGSEGLPFTTSSSEN